MKKLLAFLLAVIMMLSLFAGCSSNSATSDTAPGDKATPGVGDMELATVPTEAAGSNNGNVTLGPDSDKLTYIGIASQSFETLDPFYMNGAVAVRMKYMLFEPLFDSDFGEPIVGVLAKDWTFADDMMSIDVEIYDNIYDWKGNHITAADIVWAYTYQDSIRKTTYVTGAKQTGEYTLHIDFGEKYYDGFFDLGLAYFLGISQAEYEATGSEWRENPVGTGPYKAIKFISGARAVFQQTYNYWGDFDRLPTHRKANVDVVGLEVITEQSQVKTALGAGTIQFADISASAAEDFTKENGAITVAKFNQTYPGVTLLNMYPGSVFSDNKALREAVAYALDMDAVGYAASYGTSENYGTYGNPSLMGYNEEWNNKYYEYDVEKAKEKLAEAGYAPGELTLTYITNSGSSSASVVMQANLAEAGINLEIRELDETQYLTARGQANLLEWDMCVYAVVPFGYMMNAFKQLNDITLYNWGTIGGACDEELYELTMTALYDQTQENIDAVFEATIDQLNYIPSYAGFTFVGAYNKLTPVKSASSENAANACIFADDYDVYYEG